MPCLFTYLKPIIESLTWDHFGLRARCSFSSRGDGEETTGIVLFGTMKAGVLRPVVVGIWSCAHLECSLSTTFPSLSVCIHRCFRVTFSKSSWISEPRVSSLSSVELSEQPYSNFACTWRSSVCSASVGDPFNPRPGHLLRCFFFLHSPRDRLVR